MLPLIAVGTIAYAQIGINTPNPQGIFHVDGSKDNAATAAPTVAQQANDLIVTSAGILGVGTTTPFANAKIQAAQDKTTSDEFGQLMATGLTDPNQKLVLGYNTTADKGFIQSVHSGSTWTNLSLQPNNGNVTVGSFTGNATSKLEVNGSSTNFVAYNAGSGRNINYQLSNLAYTTASPGAFTLTGIKDGGTYSLAVQGTASGTSTFTAAGFTVKYANNRPTTGGRQTVYTLVVMGPTVYVYISTGF